MVLCASRLCSDVEELVLLPVRRDVAGLCMFYKLYHNLSHPLNDVVFAPTRRLRHTRAAVLAHDFEVQLLRYRTAQFERCFVTLWVSYGILCLVRFLIVVVWMGLSAPPIGGWLVVFNSYGVQVLWGLFLEQFIGHVLSPLCLFAVFK